MSQIEEVREDLQELKELRQAANRKCSQQLLDDQIEKLARRLNNLLVQKATEEQNSSSLEATSNECQNKTYTVTLRTYSWDQSDKFLKLYVTIPSLRPADADRVTCSFTSRGLTLAVKALNDKNYELVINNLAQYIVPEKSHKKVKDEMVVLLLKKEREGFTWPAVTAEEAKIKEKNKDADPAKNTEDPSSSIMGLMKKMYDEGDDNMKQMLNKTWYESQMKSGGGGMPNMGGMGGMPNMGGMGGMPDFGGMGGTPDMGL